MSFAKCAIYLTNIYVVRKEESLPTWERGLKHESGGLRYSEEMSLPTWERGLKRLPWHILRGRGVVAPHAGAWIETWRLSDR